MSAVPEPSARWWTTLRQYGLVGAPDEVTYTGLGFIPEQATIHTMDYGSYVWIQGRAIKRDGSISALTKRGKGYSLGITPWSGDLAPDWLKAALWEAGWPRD